VTRVGWTVRNGSFKFVDNTRALHLGKVILKANAAVPGQYKVTMKGRGGTICARIATGARRSGRRSPERRERSVRRVALPRAAPAMQSCVLNGSGSALKCR
jgi:hypothetical protein